MSDQLSNGEIAVLNAAREILTAHTKGFPDDYGQARVIVKAEDAAAGIFDFLNNASTWGDMPVTHEQLHGYPEPEPEPEPAEPQSLRA